MVQIQRHDAEKLVTGVVIIVTFLCLSSFFLLVAASFNFSKLCRGKVEKERSKEALTHSIAEIKNLSILNFKNGQLPLPINTLTDEIELVGIQKRGDIAKKPVAMLRMKKTGERLDLQSNETIYIALDTKRLGELKFSKEKTPIRLKTSLLKGGVDFKVECFFDGEGSDFKHQLDFSLKEQGGASHDPLFNRGVEALSGIKILPPDLFLEQYSDQEEKSVYRLIMNNQQKRIKDKQLFSYNGESFIPYNSNEAKCLPLLRFDLSSQNKGLVSVWDRDGICENVITVEIEKKAKISPQILEEPKQIKIRTRKSFVCMLGGKKLHIKEGDFLIKKQGGWKKVNSLEELKGLIEYKFMAELFVIDEVSSENGKVVVSGKLFDKTRCNFLPIVWNLSIKKDKKSPEMPKEINQPSQNNLEGYGNGDAKDFNETP